MLKSDTRKFVLRKAISKHEKTLKRLHLMRNRRRLIAGFRGLKENVGNGQDINSSASAKAENNCEVQRRTVQVTKLQGGRLSLKGKTSAKE